MATFTAQILVGSPHPNHGGINPTYSLFLSENSRSCMDPGGSLSRQRTPQFQDCLDTHS